MTAAALPARSLREPGVAMATLALNGQGLAPLLPSPCFRGAAREALALGRALPENAVVSGIVSVQGASPSHITAQALTAGAET